MVDRWLRALIPVVLAIAAGVVETRVAIARLEQHMTDIDRRLGAVEQAVEIHPTMAGLEPR